VIAGESKFWTFLDDSTSPATCDWFSIRLFPDKGFLYDVREHQHHYPVADQTATSPKYFGTTLYATMLFDSFLKNKICVMNIISGCSYRLLAHVIGPLCLHIYKTCVSL
jgi:hypothetical protein